MPQRKPFLLRLPRDLMEDLERWAKDDLRSINAQIEYLLREAMAARRRVKKPFPPQTSNDHVKPA